ncbi:NAD-dependent epimerase/dehydratase family protein [Paenibacillus medicaginis]|uniref:NAD-dependent epimerase/dehydratase family protein n=1 Tax=Paenibacillus medicaginis TaxID=1470560 RepID=A0ABV5C2G3_9BACL
MKAVVTGGAGFIGTHLVRALTDSGYEVHVLDNLSSGSTAGLDARAVFHQMDIRSMEAGEIVKRERPDVVFHLAAQADVQHSIRQPWQDADVNIMGTLRILEACREAGCKIVFSSTAGIYGELQKERIVEEDPTVPISCYGQSKLAAECYIRLFHHLYGVEYTILRYSNVYGPGQGVKGEGGVVALFMERLVKGEPLQIHGDGEQTRDFIYVYDVVKANMAAARKASQSTVHVSTGLTSTINGLASYLLGLHGKGLTSVHTPAKTGDIRHSCLENAKAGMLLGWKPSYSIEKGLRQTYDSWLNNVG